VEKIPVSALASSSRLAAQSDTLNQATIVKQITDGTPADKIEKAEQRKNARILKAVSNFRKLAAQLVDAASEVEELVAQGTTSTDAVRLQFVAKWERRYPGEKYPGAVARDMKSVRDLRKHYLDAVLVERMDPFFAETDRYIAKNSHSLGIFAQTIVQYGKGGRQVAGRGAQSDDADLFNRTLDDRRQR